MNDLIILYSGGSDSRLMLKMALEQGRKPLLVHVRYGQDKTHHDHKCDVDCHEVTVSGVMYDFKREWADVARDYLPNRNMILVAIAGAIAEQEGITEIWYGANKTDVENNYPDCKWGWILKMNEILPRKVSFVAPLHHLTQQKVIAKLDDNVSDI